MLARDNNKVVLFDLEEALSFDGHSAPYIQYAHARACRILEHAGETEERSWAGWKDSISGSCNRRSSGCCRGSRRCPTKSSAPPRSTALLIASYVYDLAKRFNDFYHACPVLTSPEPTRTARLALTAATRRTLANGLALLGIAAPAEM